MLSSPQLHCAILDDHNLIRNALRSITEQQGIKTCFEADSNESFLERLLQTKQHTFLDFITTDLNHPGGGIELIRTIRSLSDHETFPNGVKVKNIPIIILTMMDKEVLKEENDLGLHVHLQKNISTATLLTSINELVLDFKKYLINDLMQLGLAISVNTNSGLLQTHTFYALPNSLNTHFFYRQQQSAQVISNFKRILANIDELRLKTDALKLFENLINDPTKKEKDLHNFFKTHPEFLLDEIFESIWSETEFEDNLNNRSIRIDLLGQPKNEAFFHPWNLIELKKHTAPVLLRGKNHVDFSGEVYHAINQLKNYKDFLLNPANNKQIAQKLGGPVYGIKPIVVIGRLPSNIESYLKLKERQASVHITTYDEIFQTQKIKIDTVNQNNRLFNT